MAKDPIDTSSISFTALYTGQCWVANDLAAPEFHTGMGAFFYSALAPFEYIGGKIAGGNIRTFLLQRHHLIDHLVRQAMQEDGVTQVLEIACGLSPRGHRFSNQYPQLHYVEADLPDMAARKHALIEQTEGRHPEVVPINVFAEEGELSLASVLSRFDRSKPVLVITEGLVNYFDQETISGFWSNLRAEMSRFPLGIYLTDNYPLLHDHPFHRTMKVLRGMLGTVSRSQVTFHFSSDQEAEQCFQTLGYHPVTVHNPKDYYASLPIPESRGNPFVRIIEARIAAQSEEAASPQ